MSQKRVFTIGRNEHSEEQLCDLLRKYEIDCVLDIRSERNRNTSSDTSSDASSDQKSLPLFLKNNDIVYMSFAREFGTTDVDCAGLSDKYEGIIKTEPFQHGIVRLQNGLAKGFHIALMGEEADPRFCPRFHIVSRYLSQHGVDVQHILPDGSVCDHELLAESLLQSGDGIVRKASQARVEHNALGKWGEDVAAAYLQQHGYYIRERNWHYRHREIDIIAFNAAANTLAFVEVKTRRNNDFGDPEMGVNRKKMWFLSVAASNYVRSRNIRCDIQFDIISITGTPKTGYTVNHIQDAIPPSAYTIRR